MAMPSSSVPDSRDSLSPTPGSRAWIVVLACGVVAAMHVWKLPGAMDYIRADLGMSLVQAGALLGIVQVASMILGLLSSIFCERIGLRASLLLGLALLAVASAGGAAAHTTWVLMATRAVEGIGFLLVTVVAPPLIRRITPTPRLNTAMGWWSAFQGMAVFVAVLASTLLLSGAELVSWHAWWLIMAVLSALMIPLALWRIPPEPGTAVRVGEAARRIGRTVATWMPWVCAVIFACYTLQWGAIIGFLPTIFGDAGVHGVWVGAATAVVGLVNGAGNVIGGRLLQRGVSPRRLVSTGMVAMIVTTVVIFAPDWTRVPGGLWVQLSAAAVFSAVAALIPSSMTRVGVEAAPAEGSPAAVMGLMNQVYNGANFVGPVLLTSIATAVGGWHLSWVMTVSAALIGLMLALVFLRRPWLTLNLRG
ncbi:MAG: MFS transporter [Micrococcaceae bacterium]